MKIKEIISKLTLEQKAALLQGWTTWTTLELNDKGIPAMFMSDGPVGLRKQAGAADHLGLNESIPAPCFPSAHCLAAALIPNWCSACMQPSDRKCATEEVMFCWHRV